MFMYSKEKLWLNIQPFRLPLLFSVFSVLGIEPSFAQAAGEAALNASAAGIARYIPVVQNVVYALAAIIAIVSAVVIYKKINDGAEDAKKLIALPVLACIFLTASATALPKFFGLDVTLEDGGFTPSSSTSSGGASSGEDVGGGATGPNPSLGALYGVDVLSDGSLQYFVIGDDGTKYIASDYKTRDYLICNAKIGIGEDGKYHYYVESQGNKVWITGEIGEDYIDYMPEWFGPVGKHPDGTYRHYMLADDGTKIWSPWESRYVENRNITAGKNAAGEYEFYFLADDGTKIWTDLTNSRSIITNLTAQGVDKDPTDGKYKYYITADDGTKIYENTGWGFFAETSFGHIGIDENGKPRSYVIADDGTKIWGRTAEEQGLTTQ